MRKEKIIISSLVGCVMIFLSSIAYSKEIHYGNLFDARPAGIEVRDDGVIVADQIHSVSWCGKTSKFVCLESEVLAFSIPKSDVGATSWVRENEKYTVLQTKEGWVNGKFIQYRVIQREWKNTVVDFVYSNEFGVLAMKVLDHELNLLDGRCGFAAISNKYGCVRP